MRKQPNTGREGLIGTAGEVVSKLSAKDGAQYLVRSWGELWNANSPDALETGEIVTISDVEGIRLVVHREGKPVTST
jgi:membrane protein implicated in regulation of membrane protease activity